MWLQDTGILIKLRDSELKAPYPIPQPKVKFNQPLSIYQLATAFLLVVAGVMISISAFLIELSHGLNGRGKDAPGFSAAVVKEGRQTKG